MLLALIICVDDDLARPIYVDPDPEDVDGDLWESVAERVQEILDGDCAKIGSEEFGGGTVAWRHLSRQSLTFLAAGDDELSAESLDSYLQALSERYLDEVEDPRNPERDGVADVVVDVIPPWEDEDDWGE